MDGETPQKNVAGPMGDAPESHLPQSAKQPRQEQDTELQNGTLEEEEEDTHASDALPFGTHERTAADR